MFWTKRNTQINPIVVSTKLDVYNNLGRLETATRDGVTTTYKYDANGNRTSVQTGTDAAVTAKYDAQDRIISFGAQTYEASPTGNLASSSDGTKTLSLTYDELGNLTNAIAKQGDTTLKTIDYVIDGFGRRVGRKANGTFDKKWLYRDALRPVAEVDSTGVFTHFVYADSQSSAPDFLIRSGVLYRVVKDYLGSVRMVVNATTGAIAQSLEYDAFGRVLNETGSGFQPFGFAGGLYDADTKLVRFGARDYDPGMGRWTNKDPIGFAGGDTNIYAYVGNDPVNLVDPDGRRPLTPTERAFLEAVYGKSLNTKVIDINPSFEKGQPYSPIGNDIRLPIEMFHNEDVRYMVILSDSSIASTLVHEAFHVWQRQHGQWVTTRGLVRQTLYKLGINDPYQYDVLSTGAEMLKQFKTANVEAQAQMFEDGVTAMLSDNASTLSLYWDIINYVRNQ